jgi:coproporphyrinogen III oxidase-like Fe-S oxidoreductase
VVNALLRELGLYGKVLRDLSLSVVEIHIGGGTPSVSPLTVFDGICEYLVIPLAGLGLGAESLASSTPHGPPSSLTP